MIPCPADLLVLVADHVAAVGRVLDADLCVEAVALSVVVAAVAALRSRGRSGGFVCLGGNRRG